MTRAIALRPRYAPGYFARFIQRVKNKDIDGALADLDRTIELAPDHADALGERGMLHLRRREPQKAVADFDRYVALRPQVGDGYAGRAQARRASGDRAGAASDAKKALELGVREEMRPQIEKILRGE